MKLQSKNLPTNNMIVHLHDHDFLENQRFAGKVVRQCLDYLKLKIDNLSSDTMLSLSRQVETIILDHGCEPTFKNYKSFPESVCISINKELVHGIPKDESLKLGDIVSFDLGATFNGAIADAAITTNFGAAKADHLQLIEATKECLMNVISSIKIGEKLGVIGEIIFNTAKKYNYAVISNYGGHGITFKYEDGKKIGIPHYNPFVSNKSNKNEGIILRNGLTLAIEPLLVLGTDATTKVSNDKWTVLTNNISAHFEHTIFINDDKIEVIT